MKLIWFLLITVLIWNSEGAKLSRELSTIYIAPNRTFRIQSHPLMNRNPFYWPTSIPRIWVFKPTKILEGYKYTIRCKSGFDVGVKRNSGHCSSNKVIFIHAADRNILCGNLSSAYVNTIPLKYRLKIVFRRGNTTNNLTHAGFICRIGYVKDDIKCPRLLEIANGNVTQNLESSIGDNATFRCDPGYVLTGESFTTCQVNHEWDLPYVPVCKRIYCPRLDNITNGYVTQNQVSLPGETATFHCQSGYDLIGDDYVSCESNGTWIGPIPTCQILNCTSNMTRFGDYCYWLNGDVSREWNQCASYCRNNSGDLASITSQAVQNFTIDLAQTEMATLIALGLIMDPATGNFQWIATNTSIYPYRNWGLDQPDNLGGNEFCGGMNGHLNYEWIDMECSFSWDHCLCQIGVRQLNNL